MSWKKYFKAASGGVLSPINGASVGAQNNFKFQNYGSLLPEVYMGHPNRLERYNQYEAMDIDSEVNSALDIISEFCTQKNEQNNTPFDLFFKDKPTETEVSIIKKQLSAWCSLNELDKRMFKIFRNTLKYGDQVFLRDPETFKMFWVDMTNVVKIIVNESDGKRPEQYILRNINPNFENLTVTQVTADNIYHTMPNTSGYGAAAYNMPNNPYSTNSRFAHGLKEVAIEAQHIVQLSLTEGLDSNWPFGQSVLENIFKVYKQKELLEDSIVIYRVQRAPERRVFYIDVGSMPAHMAMAFVERVKNEIHQRRIPTQSGGQSFMDSTYNPLSINEDYFFPQTAEGRGSKVETLPGGQNLGEIDDLKFFTNKLFRGLRIPSSYLPTGAEDSAAIHNDGKVATALIQEHRFNQYCKRLQALICATLDTEFKAFMKWRGLNIDNTMFELKMNEPQNFAKYRQSELDAAKISSFSQLEAVPYMSKRFLLKRYLGLSEEEMLENTQLWREENLKAEDSVEDDVNLRNVGISPAGIESDITGLTSPEPGAEAPAPEAAGAAPAEAPAGGAAATPEV
jgi:hypothetical protein